MNITPTQTFDPLNTSLLGISLIEASAGTGKTYHITTLFLRLLLEPHPQLQRYLRVDEILVVTFTEAATEELRDRIRRRLREALIAFQQAGSEDKILTQLVQKYNDQATEAIFLLENALRGFDEAAIFTIHSFCRQMLGNNAFESGALFDTELVSDQTPLLREIVEDFWRQHFYNASPLFISYALANHYDKPAALLKTLNYGQYLGQPFLQIIPRESFPVMTVVEAEFQGAFQVAQTLWTSAAPTVIELLQTDNLNKAKYKLISIPQWGKELTDFFQGGLRSVVLPEHFKKFTRSELSNSVKKGKTPPTHEFFECCEQLFHCQQRLAQTFKQYLLALQVKLFEVAETGLTRKKSQRHIQSFDDLLINLYQALHRKTGGLLAQSIRNRYRAALIDEFQDTDPVQYEIFHTIYGMEQQTLFLIGDPKQAIYSFRGADIFTYIAANRQATQRHTLNANWRSEDRLIEAVNHLFTRSPQPFWFKEITFLPAQPPLYRPLEQPQLTAQGTPIIQSPLQIWLVARSQADRPPEKPITKEWAEQTLPLVVADEIVRLLTWGASGLVKIGERPLAAGDIAILVRTHTQARIMQKALTRLRVPSVLYSRDSLFNSHEIVEIERVLLAIAEVSNEGLVKAALTTDLLGHSGDELYWLMATEYTWQQRLHRFQQYRALWQAQGFIRMFRELLLEEQVPARLLSYPEGERRLTNVLHAAEILQQATLQNHLGINGLCQWLAQQRQPLGEVSEEQQLRLESDEKLVKIITIHKSKGLEYPIVFAPFVWNGHLYTRQTEPFTFHNEQEILTLDLGSAEQAQHYESALQEERAENLRLFYVAVTRAKHRCYLIWGAFNDADTSPLAHLLHPDLESVEKTSDEQLWRELTQLEEAARGTWAVSWLPIPAQYTPYQRPLEQVVSLTARPFFGQIDQTWRVSSFSSLLAQGEADRPDYDELTFRQAWLAPEELSQLESQSSIFSFPRGAQAGNFIHALFEHLDFTQVESAVISQQLRAFGYEVTRWQPVITTLVEKVLHTPLVPNQPMFTLSRIANAQRLNELEFYYPLPQLVTTEGLQQCFAQAENTDSLPSPPGRGAGSEGNDWLERIGRLEFAPAQGFMKGFIDMVFVWEGRYYLVDYKSNFLGTRTQNYHHSQLAMVMTREAYFLQYHIYVVALHRYLSWRVPNYRYEEHFGGVYYLFVRGMQPEWGGNYGIYRDLPRPDLVERLSQYLAKPPSAPPWQGGE